MKKIIALIIKIIFHGIAIGAGIKIGSQLIDKLLDLSDMNKKIRKLEDEVLWMKSCQNVMEDDLREISRKII